MSSYICFSLLIKHIKRTANAVPYYLRIVTSSLFVHPVTDAQNYFSNLK
nr:MAG TPA: hypothetical protein [Bacteriophage sp.]